MNDAVVFASTCVLELRGGSVHRLTDVSAGNRKPVRSNEFGTLFFLGDM